MYPSWELSKPRMIGFCPASKFISDYMKFPYDSDVIFVPPDL